MRYVEPTSEQLEGWKSWVAERPEKVRVVAERFDPWTLYRLKTSGHRVTVGGFDELQDGRGTVRVTVSGEFNFVSFERGVFGIDPNDLEECDLPGPDEPLGTTDWPIEVVKEMGDRFPDGMPDEVKKDLLVQFPVRVYVDGKKK